MGGLLHVSVAFAPFRFQKSRWSKGEVCSYLSAIQLSWTDGRTALRDISSESLVLETLLWGSGIYSEGVSSRPCCWYSAGVAPAHGSRFSCSGALKSLSDLRRRRDLRRLRGLTPHIQRGYDMSLKRLGFKDGSPARYYMNRRLLLTTSSLPGC